MLYVGLAPGWPDVSPMCGLMLGHVGPMPMLGQVAPMYPNVGPMLSHVGPKLGQVGVLALC